jgi:hypothetical protein
MGSGDVAAICAEHTFSFIGFEIDRFASKATASRLFMESSAKSAEVAKAEVAKTEVAKSANENREGEYFNCADDLI